MEKITLTDLVTTTNGPIYGLLEDDMCKYLGIPFAAPPIGELRWRPPVVPARGKNLARR